MPIRRFFTVLLLMVLLTGCLTQILVSASRELLWQLLTPMIGLDPNQANLFEQPIIKDRLTALLGPQYEPVMRLLKTADELQREGPLFYVVSRYTPVPELAEKAGFVWNSETNQMAIMLVTGGSPTVIAEKFIEGQVKEQVGQLIPQWPGELQSILDKDALKKNAAEAAAAGVANALLNVAEVPSAQETPGVVEPMPQQMPVLPVQDADAILEAELKAQEAAEHATSGK